MLARTKRKIKEAPVPGEGSDKQYIFLMKNKKKQFKADRLQIIVVAKKYICVATVHQ